MNRKVGEFILHANKRGVPYISLTTQDQLGTVGGIMKEIEGEDRSCMLWTPLSISGLNEEGGKSLSSLLEKRNTSPKPISLIELLKLSGNLHRGSIVFLLNAHYYLSPCDVGLSSAILEARLTLKASLVTVIFLSPDVSFPLELRGEILSYDVPPLGDSQIESIVSSCYALIKENVKEKYDKKLPPLTPSQLKQYRTYLRGLTPFSVENTFTLAASHEGIHEDSLFEQKKEALKQVKGITLTHPTFCFRDLAGMEGIKKRFTRIIQGKLSPEFIAFVDEIGDMFSGGDNGDNTGTKQYMRGKFLEEMERQKTQGVLLTGVQGTGKSSIPEALAGEFNLPFIRIDLGALFESKLGHSESNIRTLFKTLEGLSGGNPFLLVGAANTIVNLRPQERRRFTFGVYHFDLPTEEELLPIWDIQLKKWGLNDKPLKEPNLTGAEIRNMCQEAYMTSCSLEEARSLTVPYYIANMDKVRELRKIADKNYLDPSTGEIYSIEGKKKTKSRTLDL